MKELIKLVKKNSNENNLSIFLVPRGKYLKDIKDNEYLDPYNKEAKKSYDSVIDSIKDTCKKEGHIIYMTNEEFEEYQDLIEGYDCK
ncbi:hypothetical protein M0R19_02245 [Candidatus Pacearchaeota archaeon]|nr:hypothetical protein [Candidatus Pacearchaeota archaeon]